MNKLIPVLLLLTGSLICLSSISEEDPCEQAQKIWTHGENNLAQGSPESQKALQQAIDLCPAYAMAWREKGVPYLKRGDFGTWARYINKAVELDPLGFLAIRSWCRFSFLRDYEGTIADLSRLDTLVHFTTFYANDFNIYLLLGEAHQALGHYDKALTYYDKCIANTIKERGEKWVGLYDYLYRGILKYKTGDYTGALKDFDNEIMIYESLADPYYFKGLTYLKLNEKEKAKVELTKALDLITGKGFKHEDPYTEVQDEIYRSDIELAVSQLK